MILPPESAGNILGRGPLLLLLLLMMILTINDNDNNKYHNDNVNATIHDNNTNNTWGAPRGKAGNPREALLGGEVRLQGLGDSDRRNLL